MTSTDPHLYATEIVRIFPDYAQTVVWFMDPFPYDQTRLSDSLVERLSGWESSYYGALTDDFEWRSRTALHTFSADGLELACEMAAEIGPDFEVEYRSFENSKAVARLRSEHPASNPEACAAFGARAERARAGWAAMQAAREAAPPGSGGGWYARGSWSGAIFRPR